MSLRADVAVIGAGPAGAAVALALARAGRSVLLAERSATPRRVAGESVAPDIRLPLEQLDLWREFEADGHLPSHGNLSAWGSARPGGHDFLFNPYGNGWHLDRLRFDTMLRRRATQAGARLHEGATLEHASRDDDGAWRLAMRTAEGRVDWTAGYVVDASGRAAAFARRCGAWRRPLDHLVGVVAWYSGGQPLRQVTLVEAERDGWWYSAPLPQQRMVLAFMTEAGKQPASALRERLMRPDAAHAPLTCQRLAEYGGTADAPAIIVPAFSARLGSAGGDGWLAVGDAAASYDPLSSQGICSALKQGVTAAAALDAALDGDTGGVRDYAAGVQSMYADYLTQRTAFYRRERRWPESDFWRQRWLVG